MQGTWFIDSASAKFTRMYFTIKKRTANWNGVSRVIYEKHVPFMET